MAFVTVYIPDNLNEARKKCMKETDWKFSLFVQNKVKKHLKKEGYEWEK